MKKSSIKEFYKRRVTRRALYITAFIAIICFTGRAFFQSPNNKNSERDDVRATNNNAEENEENGSYEAHLNEEYRNKRNTLVIHEILERERLLAQMQDWNGKILVVKANSNSPLTPLQYFDYQTLYQDSNKNAIQDKGDQGFFNPASTVKIAIAALALEKTNALGLDRTAEYRVINGSNWHRIDEDIRLSVVISDNDAANRLILWLGFEHINNALKDKSLEHFAVERLMLNQGTLIDSPAFELRFNGQEKKIQSPKSVSIKASCYEKDNQIGNCATASDLVEVLIRIVQPEYFSEGEQFILTKSDRMWLQEKMTSTPQQEGFKFPDNYCRFLIDVEKQFSSQSGRMLSKCGVALFSNTYVDLSLIEADNGRKYYVVFAVTPPRSVDEEVILQWMNTTAGLILSQLP